MATTVKPETLVGKKIRRKEDPRLITGTATYVDDIKMPGMHHACIVRSPHAAAAIRSINTKPALDRPGVVAVFTGADVESVGPVPCGASLPGLRVPHHAILANDRVFYVGHPVAVVVATDRYIAADAVDLIEVDYAPTQAVSDPEKAIAPGAPAVHPEWPDNVAFNYHQEGDVIRPLRMDCRSAGGDCFFRVGDSLRRSVIHFDEIDCVGGDVAIGGYHDGYGMAHVEDAVLGQNGMVRNAQSGQGSAAGDRPDRFDIGPGEDGDHARTVQ